MKISQELSQAREEIARRDRDGWCRVFARSLTEELDKDFNVDSRKSNRGVTWSSTSRQRLFGGDSIIEEEDDDDMTEGVTSMLNSFRSVSPSKSRYTSPLRRNKSSFSSPLRKSSSPFRKRNVVVTRRNGNISGIYSILDRLKELSDERLCV